MLLPSGETSTDSQVPWSVVNSTLRAGFRGRVWSFFASVGAGVDWSLPCRFCGTAKEASGSNRVMPKMKQFNALSFVRGFISKALLGKGCILGLFQCGRQKAREGSRARSCSDSRKQRNCTPSMRQSKKARPSLRGREQVEGVPGRPEELPGCTRWGNSD